MVRVESNSKRIVGGRTMRQIMNFVKNTFKDIPKENDRDNIILTVTEMLLEKVEDLEETGLTEQEAIDKTVLEFGSAEDYLDRMVKVEKKAKRRKTIAHYRNDVLFSFVSTIIIIGVLAYINLYFGHETLWFIIPAILLLFWPLSVIYHLLNKKANNEEDLHE